MSERYFQQPGTLVPRRKALPPVGPVVRTSRRKGGGLTFPCRPSISRSSRSYRIPSRKIAPAIRKRRIASEARRFGLPGCLGAKSRVIAQARTHPRFDKFAYHAAYVHNTFQDFACVRKNV